MSARNHLCDAINYQASGPERDQEFEFTAHAQAARNAIRRFSGFLWISPEPGFQAISLDINVVCKEILYRVS